LAIERFLLPIHTSGTVCHVTSEDGETTPRWRSRFCLAAASRPDFLFPTAADFILGLVPFWLNALFIN